MRLLIDSHIALWWLAEDPSIGMLCKEHLRTADEVFFSAVTPWELGIKRALGKVSYPDGLARELTSSGFRELPVSAEHAERAPDLPLHHRDPFDRLLVAQAQAEALMLVSADRSLRPYDVEIIDARL